MFTGRDSDIADLLQSEALLSPEQVQKYSQQAFEQSRDFAECVMSSGVLDKDQMLDAIANALQYPRIESYTSERIAESEIERIVPLKVAQHQGVFPLGADESEVHLAVADPFNHEIQMDLEHYLNREVSLYIADPEWVKEQIEIHYSEGDLEQNVSNLDLKVEYSQGLEDSATIIDYVDTLLQKSIQDGASDIHFEPFEKTFRIRYRVDGNLKEIPSHVGHLGAAIISRIKVMARLNIAETRVPQDGRIQIPAMGRAVDVRVSTLPTQFGESVVLRILDKTKVNLDLDMLGMPEDVLSKLRSAIHAPNGIFLATGPTGSGKTTTLYSALRELNDPGSKLLTVEDPVEYDIDGIVQVQTHALIGLDFARSLRSFLRHDPDKILLGEIRDTETARIAVQASLTGHMVFSSLHTNDASGAVTRFVDMGVEPYLVAASLVAVLAQRLLRRLDPAIREWYDPADVELAQLGIDRSALAGGQFCRTQSSAASSDAYRGRVGLYELIVVNDFFREAITARKSHAELARLACENGMRELREDGVRALLAGLTSVEEVLRYT